MNVISIESRRVASRPQPQGAQVVAGAGKPVRLNSDGHTRRAVLRMFILGAGLRKAGKLHPQGEPGFAQDLREVILNSQGPVGRVA